MAMGASMDLLSELLGSVRLTGGIFLDSRFTAPWCVIANISPECSKPFLTNPVQLVGFHVVVEGEVVIGFEDSLQSRRAPATFCCCRETTATSSAARRD